MSLHFISGKPGGGKSLYAVRLILWELMFGTRMIVTNVALKFPELHAYLLEHGRGVRSEHIRDRVLTLEEEDLPVFFTFRGQGVRLQHITNADWKKGERPDYSKVKDAGVFYVLDEVHIAFNSRAWADTGHEVLYYLSQHRKLGDDVVAVTQQVENVDKQFRSVAQDFTYIRNLKKERMGLFRMPGIFSRKTYAHPSKPGTPGEPMEHGVFTLDVSGIACCYDTAKGVGIHGRASADMGHKSKGVHWLVAVIGAPVVLICLFLFVPRVLGHWFNIHSVVVSESKSAKQGALTLTHSTNQAAAVVVSNRPSLDRAIPPVSTNVFLAGLARVNGRWQVYLSTGEKFVSGDGHLQRLEPERAVIDGVVYGRKKAY